MTLKREQMALLSPLLDEALPLDEAGRRAWLQNLPPEHQPLAEMLEAALLPEAAQSEKLETLPKIISTLVPQHDTASELTAGCRVGPYELIRLLGAGGMAEVWLAKRADGAFKREVALKLPMRTRFRKELAERFARERDILASLEHPNIARLYDAGVDAEGLPYIAMEYVPGQPIATWCDEHKVGIQKRLQLFLHVIEAVEYAHEKQVIHRDLKPSNILVTESGQVRLLDFGVAKLLVDETDRTQLTSVYGRALTPDYASPELLKGDPIDARSDVYSLGVVLYELLSGARPYRLKGAGTLGLLEQAIGAVEVKKPSTQIEAQAAAARSMTPENLARDLKGDLDVIVLKALAKDPGERYASAAAMHEDLERYLKNRPIKARPAPLSYRVRKFVVRNRPMITVSALAGVLVLAIGGYEFAHRWVNPPVPPAPPFHPPPHSIAVLPFVNMSGDKEQEYFSDGVSEELLNSLSRITELRVAARASSFYFKGEHVDLSTIAHKLNVAAILEGSVRRSGNTIRISAELSNAITGFHLWSQTYDRDLGNILKIQTDIASAVVSALKVTLLGDIAAKVELGGTHNPKALDAYLRGRQAGLNFHDAKDVQTAIAGYSEAIDADSGYALAFARRSRSYIDYANLFATTSEERKRFFGNAEADARIAIALAPDLAEAHVALESFFENGLLDFTKASEEYERALALLPTDSSVLLAYGYFSVAMGRAEAGIAAVRRAVELDPLGRNVRYDLGYALYCAHRYEESIGAFEDMLSLDPHFPNAAGYRGLAYYARGEFERARASCELKPAASWTQQLCLAVTYEKLGRHTDAQAQLTSLVQSGDSSAYQAAEIYAQWRQTSKALERLETALRLGDPGLVDLVDDPLLAPIQKEPRYQAIRQKLKFPDSF
jgi:eukaryotic-like serine/threonine-protein kinase